MKKKSSLNLLMMCLVLNLTDLFRSIWAMALANFVDCGPMWLS